MFVTIGVAALLLLGHLLCHDSSKLQRLLIWTIGLFFFELLFFPSMRERTK